MASASHDEPRVDDDDLIDPDDGMGMAATTARPTRKLLIPHYHIPQPTSTTSTIPSAPPPPAPL